MAKKSFDQRSEDEAKEGYDTVKTGQPSGRFQESKQVLSPEDLGVTKSSIPGSEAAVSAADAPVAKKVKSKMKIAPDASVEELGSKQVGGVPLSGNLSIRSVAGLSGQSSGDDASKIPYTPGGYRPDSRYGKKRSEELFEMDNTISEQIAPIVEDALDLAESPDSKQGYNGRKQFKQTRGKKNFKFTNGSSHSNGKAPQQLLNECSLDFVHTSKTIYTTGQVIDFGTGSNGNVRLVDPQADYPSVKATDPSNVTSVAIQMHKGNYKPTSLDITISGGKISAIEIKEKKFEVLASPLARDEANLNWQVDANNVAKSIIKLQKELGRETTDKWSPLGYVINEPYQYNMLYHDIEATTGAIMALAYRSAVSSLAFQKNILAKDGVNPQVNAIKMILEGYAGELQNGDLITNSAFSTMIWSQSQYRAGSAAAIIAMFDSINKYRTKADLMGTQRSFGLHLSQADNNINPLHCKPNFIKALDKAHLFSTMTGAYNPMLPIFATKIIDIINPLSLNVFLKGWKHPGTLTAAEIADPLRNGETGTYANYSYAYKDVRNTYATRVAHPLIEGLLRWLLKHEGAFCTIMGNGTVSIPFSFDMQAPSLLAFMLCSASQEILWARNIAYRDVLFAGEQMTYIWDDLVGVDKLNPLYSSQLTIGRYTDPLKLGKLAPDAAIREMWGSRYTVKAKSSDKIEYFAPWHFNERAFGVHGTDVHTANEGFKSEPTAFNMTIPSIKDGVRHEYVDLIKSMSERDIRLALDRQVEPMRFISDKDTTTLSGMTIFSPVGTSSVYNSYLKTSALRYEGNSDGRIILTYDLTSGSNRNLYMEALYCVPKELGFIEDRYEEVGVITGFTISSDKLTAVSTTVIGQDLTFGLGNAPAYDGFAPYKLQSYRVKADSDTAGAIDRSAALTQTFYCFFASDDASVMNAEFVAKTGIVPVLSYSNAAYDTLYAVYNKDSINEASGALSVTVNSMASRVYSLLQRFFMQIGRAHV